MTSASLGCQCPRAEGDMGRRRRLVLNDSGANENRWQIDSSRKVKSFFARGLSKTWRTCEYHVLSAPDNVKAMQSPLKLELGLGEDSYLLPCASDLASRDGNCM